MSWQDILKFDSRTDKEIIKELSDLQDLMGKYLDREKLNRDID